MASIRLVDTKNPLHLYRHILREASYLPPLCRPFAVSRIQTRFRKHKNDKSPKRRLSNALQQLRFLRAANAGDLLRMRRVLLLATGRLGPRRRHLMENLRRHDAPADTAALEAEIRGAEAASTQNRPADWLDKWNHEKLLVFAKSQQQAGLKNLPRPNVKSQLKPEMAVPEINSWGRPFAAKVARGKERRWWIAFANRLVPPVAKGEWDLLRALATGKAGKEWDVPPRRTPVLSDQRQEWQWERYASESVQSIERPYARSRRALNGHADRSTIGVHTFTSRLWRRLYAEIWRFTATIEEKDGKPGEWNITWGSTPTQPTATSSLHNEFFEGVDHAGKLIKAVRASPAAPLPAKEG